MTAKILDGTALASIIRAELKTNIEQLKQQNLSVPGLAVILLGQDPASHIYVSKKRQACKEIGMHSLAYDLPADTSQEKLLQLIATLNADPEVHGILVQLPLPKHFDPNLILESIDPYKDVDGFHPYNLGRLAQKRPFLRPCTSYGVMKLLDQIHTPLEGMNAVIVGASNIVGRPMALELLMVNSTVTICHRYTQNLADHIRTADLLIVAIGKTNVIQSSWIKPGAIVVDIGTNRLSNGSLVGDVDFESAKERASWITPVPGGVGPMTVTMLLQNTFYAYHARNVTRHV